MKFTYPAVFHKTEQGTYEGYFPDLACCYAKGDTKRYTPAHKGVELQ